MLPIKIELTKELSVKLRDLRLNNPVDGTVLTAENLSKAIGNNRAWMSQIESGRLKNIKREDLISIYKLLFHISSDIEAENKAETDLLNYILKTKQATKKKGIVIVPNSQEKECQHNTYEKTFSKKSKNTITNIYREHCKDLYSSLLELFDTGLDDEQKKTLAKNVEHIDYMLFENGIDFINNVSAIPFHLYAYADECEKNNIQEKIQLLADELNSLNYKYFLHAFQKNIGNATEFALKNRNLHSLTDSLVFGFIELLQIVFNEDKISLAQKIKCINSYILLLRTYADKESIVFALEPLPDDSTIDDIKYSINYLQSIVNGLKGSSTYFSKQASDYFD